MVKLELKFSKEAKEMLDKALTLLDRAVPQPTPMYSTRMAAIPVAQFDSVTEEEKMTVEAWLKEIDPVIEKEAVAMMKQQVKDMMLMGGNVKRVAEELKKGKKPKLVRKKEGMKDPIYIQIGDGVEEPIEEIYLLG